MGKREERGSVLCDSETLKYNPETSLQGEGVGRNRRDPQVKNLASDSIEKTTQNPWFSGMWTARNKVSALSLVGWSASGITNKKDFQAYLRNKRANDNGHCERTSGGCSPPPVRGRERREPPQKLAPCVYGLPRKV